MAKETYENMVLKPNYDHLPNDHVSPANLLKQWGGSLDFDIDAYIRWRADEEGLADSLPSIMDPASIRTFDGVVTDVSAADAGGDSAGSTEGGLESAFSGINAATLKQLEGNDGVTRMGSVQKRGSGVGMFASVKWKAKLLCVAGGCALYFDSTATTEKNKVDKVFNLTGAYAERCSNDNSNDNVKPPGGKLDCVFRVVTPARSFHFACDTEAEVELWLEAFEAEISAA
jgi:hypothetical protein